MRWKEVEATGWGRVLKGNASLVRPERRSHFAALAREVRGPAVGARRSYGDAAIPVGGQGIDMTRLDRLLAFDPDKAELEAEAGVSFASILSATLPRGFIPAVMPGTAFATLGGAAANDVHGKNHHATGSFGQHVLGLRLWGADGEPREVAPDRDQALFRATMGGLGQTGIIERMRIKLLACPSGLIEAHEERAGNLSEFMALFEGSRAAYSVGWVDATAKGEMLGRGIFEEGAHHPDDSPRQRKVSSRPVPFNLPTFALSAPVVRWFNRVWYGRVPARGRNRLRPLHAFFFPLDALSNWNRLYGKRGFHQFQCVLPGDGAAEVIGEMLKQITASGLASPLAVLKKTGPGRAGQMSFPIEGYTLAVDFPARDRTGPLLATLNGLTAEAGGRIYLAKDSSAEPGQVARMYPELSSWRDLVNTLDPERRFETALTRRLNLRGRE